MSDTEIKSQNSSENPLNSVINSIGNDFSNVKPLLHLAKMINVPQGQLVMGSFVLIMMCIVFGFFSDILTAIVGMLYPAYMSFKAIETNEEDDDKQWLIYWVVFSFLHISDGVLSMILKFFPFYYPLKVILYVFLFHPKTKGALLIYNIFLKPLL